MSLSTACPLCQGDTRRLFSKDSYWIRDCEGCGHRHAELHENEDHVQRIYDDSYFNGGGAGYRDYLSEDRLLRAHGRRYARMLKRYVEPGRVLDVGCAAGFLLAGMIDRGWIGSGLEPNPKMARFAREELGLSVENSSLEAYESDEHFDLVSMIQVLPHFVDPKVAIEKATTLVRPNGHLLLETWNRDSYTARWFGHRWHEYSPPSVLHWFSRAGLTALLESFGFKPVATGRPMKWLNSGHAKSLLSYKWQDSRFGRAASTMLRIVPEDIPVPYPAEDLSWLLMRKPA